MRVCPGSPPRYFPVSIPLANGDQIVVPNPMSPYSGANSFSTLSRVNILYCGCSMVGGDESVFARRCVCLRDLIRRPFGCAPIKYLTLVDQVGHGADRFFHRCFRVGPVTEIQVEIIHLQPTQRGMTCLDDVFTTQALLVGLVTSPKDLARHDEFIARPSTLFKDFTHDNFRLPGGIRFGVIEEIDASIERRWSSDPPPFPW